MVLVFISRVYFIPKGEKVHNSKCVLTKQATEINQWPVEKSWDFVNPCKLD